MVEFFSTTVLGLVYAIRKIATTIDYKRADARNRPTPVSDYGIVATDVSVHTVLSEKAGDFDVGHSVGPCERASVTSPRSNRAA